MAPTINPRSASGQHLRTVISRSASSTFNSLSSRSTDPAKTSIASLFAVVLKATVGVSKQALSDLILTPRSPVSEAIHPVFINPSNLLKRQEAILAIPTTYAGLNAGPAPGAVVGIVLGTIAGFILILYIFFSGLRLSGYWTRETIIEENEVHRHRSSRRSRSRPMSEVHSPRREREVVREEREETVIVEEEFSPEPASVVVEEEEDDIVEVIEEHSPERSPKRRPSGRSGFRTVDPAEFGGGSRPMRKVSRR